MARETGGCRQLGQTDTAGAGPIQTTAECSLSVVWGVRERGPQDQELCRGRRQRKALRAHPGPGRVSGTKACRERFCNIGGDVPYRTGDGNPSKGGLEAEDEDGGRGQGKSRTLPCLQKKCISKEVALGVPLMAEQSCPGVQGLPSSKPPTTGEGDPITGRVRGLHVLGTRPGQMQQSPAQH